MARHPTVDDAVVAIYPAPATRGRLQFSVLQTTSSSSSSSSSDSSLSCLQSFNVTTLKCDATQISVSTEYSKALALGQSFLHLIDFSRIQEGKSQVSTISSLNSDDHNFHSQLRSSSFNPWIESEVVVSSKEGEIRLWDVEADSLLKLFVGEVRFADPVCEEQVSSVSIV